MDKKDILRLANNPIFISGIYNYCDRWCERCTFTSRCLNYAIEKEDVKDIATRDLNNKLFWDKLQSMLAQTIKMITEFAMERGIDLDSLNMKSTSNDPYWLDKAMDHELSLTARRYSEIVDMWFESEYPLFEKKQDKLNTILRAGIGGDKPCTEADKINDAVEVIRWYQHLIYIKLIRALSNEELIDRWEEDNSTQRDSDGSALVALIAIDRSMVAWGRLQEYFAEKTNSILYILLHLNKLRQLTDQSFPNARNFKRPGFDDMS